MPPPLVVIEGPLDGVAALVGGSIIKSPCEGELSGRSPVDRGKQGTKRRWSPTAPASPSPWSPPAPTGTTHPCRAGPGLQVVGGRGGGVHGTPVEQDLGDRGARHPLSPRCRGRHLQQTRPVDADRGPARRGRRRLRAGPAAHCVRAADLVVEPLSVVTDIDSAERLASHFMRVVDGGGATSGGSSAFFNRAASQTLQRLILAAAVSGRSCATWRPGSPPAPPSRLGSWPITGSPSWLRFTKPTWKGRWRPAVASTPPSSPRCRA